MKAFMLKTIASLCLLGEENNVEVTSSIGVNKAIDKSDITIDYQAILEGKYSYFFANPRLNISKSGILSGGMGLGIRKDLGNSLAGLHLFGDYSYLYGSHHFQFGPSLEYIHPKWDVTLNYYLPISGKGILDDSIIQAIHHVDGHLFYKTRFADVGIEPSYNWKTNQYGAVAHVTVPSVIGNFRLSAGRNARHGDHAKIGISLPLYGTISHVHKQKVRRATGVICDVRTDIPEKPEVVEPVLAPVIEEIIDDSQSWLDYLFGWLVPTDEYIADNPYLDLLNNDVYGCSDDYYSDSYSPSTELGGEIDRAPSTPSSSSDSPHDYYADIDSPVSDLPDLSPIADYASLSESGYMDSVGEMLASDGGYSLTVDSVDADSSSMLDISVDSSPDVSSNIGSGDSPDSADSYDVIGEHSPYSTGH